MSTTIDIRLPDGAIKQMPNGSTPFEVAQSISEGLARAVISASYNGATIEATTPLHEDGELVLFTWNNDEGKKAFWHSSAHLLAQALEQMYPGIKLTIGPAIDSGFYYDIDPGEHNISEKDLPAIEKRMIELARGNTLLPCVRLPNLKPSPFTKRQQTNTRPNLLKAWMMAPSPFAITMILPISAAVDIFPILVSSKL
jgi:threonyl-tRNA synthetase